VRARHEVAALVAGLVLALDGARPEIVGVETMKILRRAKVRVRASASEIASPSPSTSNG
jgi:hypothetical protein